MNLADFLNADIDVIVFSQTDALLFEYKRRGSTAVVLLVLSVSLSVTQWSFSWIWLKDLNAAKPPHGDNSFSTSNFPGTAGTYLIDLGKDERLS